MLEDITPDGGTGDDSWWMISSWILGGIAVLLVGFAVVGIGRWIWGKAVSNSEASTKGLTMAILAFSGGVLLGSAGGAIQWSTRESIYDFGVLGTGGLEGLMPTGARPGTVVIEHEEPLVSCTAPVTRSQVGYRSSEIHDALERIGGVDRDQEDWSREESDEMVALLERMGADDWEPTEAERYTGPAPGLSPSDSLGYPTTGGDTDDWPDVLTEIGSEDRPRDYVAAVTWQPDDANDGCEQDNEEVREGTSLEVTIKRNRGFEKYEMEASS